MRFRTRLQILACAALLFPGCAAVQKSVLTRSPQEQAQLRPILARPATPAAEVLARSGRGTDAERLASALEAARLSWPGALQGRRDDLVVNRAAVRRIVELQAAAGWKLQPAAGGVTRRIEIVRGGRDRIDPAAVTHLVPSDQVRIRGLRERVVVEGVGLPCVAWFAPDVPLLRTEPGVPPSGMGVPVTVVVAFPGKGAARMEFIPTLRQDKLPAGGRTRRLAADFTAPIALAVGKGPNRSMDVKALLFPLEHISRAGLYQFQPHDPAKIPVVFIHGLLSRPETWRQVLNELQSDPVVRQRYQFWFFLYPTGLPVWKSGALLRSELDRFNAAFAPAARNAAERRHLGSKILIGHSMGGLIANMMIREGGPSLWTRFSETPVERLPIGPDARARLEELMFFAPRTDVSRVIFAAVPHRGSRLALRPSVSFFAARVRFALPEIQRYRPLLLARIRAGLRRDLEVPANSLRFLRAGSPFLDAILELPSDRRVAIHSIIGDRGRNDAPRGGDGVVDYASAHYPGAVSEKIVPSGHGAHEHPEAIREMKRILREAL